MAVWGPKRITRFTASLTPAEEISELQLASFQRHVRNGTSPGNPKWYRPQVIRPFVPQLSVKTVSLGTGQDWHTKHSTSRPDPFDAVRGLDGAAYVQAFQAACGLALVVAATPSLQPRRERTRRAA